MALKLADQLHFLRGYFRAPSKVGAVAPSSVALARALCEPYRRCNRPARVLEVGAGTGVFTRQLGTILKAEDHLDICEIDSSFAVTIQREVLNHENFAAAKAEGRVRLLNIPVQEIDPDARYDFVISGLPLTAFGLRDVRKVLLVLRRCLKPGGVLSYFEYAGLRRTSSTLALGKRRRRVRLVSAYLTRNIRAHQVHRRLVLGNLPPAHARHFQFDDKA